MEPKRPPLQLPDVYLNLINENQRKHSESVSAIHPYIKGAFDQWYAQNTTPELPAFLGHYFGRPPNPTEVTQMETLLGLKMRYNRDQEELGLLHSQAVHLRDQEMDTGRDGGSANGSARRNSMGGRSRETWSPEKRATIPTGPASSRLAVSEDRNQYTLVPVGPVSPSEPEVPTTTFHPPQNSQQARPASNTPTASSAKSSSISIKSAKFTRPAVNGELYERLAHVGEGTYGKVYKARNVETGAFYALKRIRMEGEKDGFPVTAMREIKLLQGLKHPNVLRLAEMMVSKGTFWLVHAIFQLISSFLLSLLGLLTAIF